MIGGGEVPLSAASGPPGEPDRSRQPQGFRAEIRACSFASCRSPGQGRSHRSAGGISRAWTGLWCVPPRLRSAAQHGGSRWPIEIASRRSAGADMPERPSDPAEPRSHHGGSFLTTLCALFAIAAFGRVVTGGAAVGL